MPSSRYERIARQIVGSLDKPRGSRAMRYCIKECAQWLEDQPLPTDGGEVDALALTWVNVCDDAEWVVDRSG